MPQYLYDTVPTYFVVAGLVFQPLTLGYMVDRIEDLPLGLYRYGEEGYRAKTPEMQDIVLLTEVLPDQVNAGYEYANYVVREVNGVAITSMEALVAAFEDDHEGAYHHIILGAPGESPVEIALSKKSVAERSGPILKKYDVPNDRSADLQEMISETAPGK